MPRVKIGSAPPNRKSLDAKLARMRELGTQELQARWRTVFRKPPPPHLPRHLLFRVLAYRIQADCLGDLDESARKLLDQPVSPENAGKRASDRAQRITDLRPGTVLGQEWNGRMHRVTVLTSGFAWNGRAYSSLSKIAFAITGTR